MSQESGVAVADWTLNMRESLVGLRISAQSDPKMMLEQASLWLAQGREIIRMIARENEEIGSGVGDEIYGALTLLELAKNMVDLVEIGGRDESR